MIPDKEIIMNLKKKAKELKFNIPVIFLALKEKETPILAKIFAAITVIYALSPIDLIPDFIPILGYLDDVIILPVLIACTIKLIPNEILESCRLRSQNLWEDGKPKKWYYAIPILLFWLLIVLLVIKLWK